MNNPERVCCVNNPEWVCCVNNTGVVVTGMLCEQHWSGCNGYVVLNNPGVVVNGHVV